MDPQPEPIPSAAGSASKEESPGLIGRLTGIYFSPSETYPAIGRAPKFILPIIIMGIVAACSSYVLINRIGYENLVRKRMQPIVDAGWMTQEQADEQIRASTTGTAATIAKIQEPVTAAIIFAVIILAMTGIFKLISLIFGAENQFKPLLGVTAWTFLAIGLLQTLLLVIVVYLKAPDEIDMINPVGSNLGALLGAFAGVPKFVKALASYVDVFSIWRIALLAIGYAAVSRKLKASTAAVALTVLYVIVAVAMSGVTAMFT